MDNDPYDSGWGNHRPPLLRLPAIRGAITIIVVVTFVMLTLMSTCTPRSRPIGSTTTTIDEVSA